ncbi:MAG TPA: LysM domain-containing protein [Chloroflexi bacterium]|nr:LysM domain-containing protein [Chloroflexota bacterium]
MKMKTGLAFAAAAALILAILLPMVLDRDHTPPPLPRLVHAAGPSFGPAPPGLLTGAELTLIADLPDAPPKAPVYVAYSRVPATPEEALAWAQEFGLTDGRLYRDPREPEAIFVRTGDDRHLTFRHFGPMAEIHYGDDKAAAREGAPLSFEQAAEAAVRFLREHNLLPDEYRVQDPAIRYLAPDHPLRLVEIVPLLDGQPVVGDHVSMHVSVNPAGEVTYAAINPLTFEKSHTYPIKSAQEACATLSDGDAGRPFRLNIDRSAPDAPDIRRYQPEPPARSIGDMMTIAGWVQVLAAEDGSDVWARLSGRDGVAYDLTGPRLAELIDVGYNDVLVTGTLVAQTGAQRWQLALSEWGTAPPQKFECLVGTFVWEGDEAWLKADEAAPLPEAERYRLPGAPDELEGGERVEVCAAAWPAVGAAVDWRSLTTPPISEQTPVVGSSSTIVVVEAIEESPTAPPPPTPTPLPRTHVVQTGETLRVIADQYGITVDDLLAANNGLDASQISVGQALVIPEPSQPVTETQPAPAATSTPVPHPQMEIPFEIGQQVEITGVVYAIIYVEGDTRRIEVNLDVRETNQELPPYPLLGPQELLEEIAEHHRLHVRVWGEIVAAGEAWRPVGQAIQVERFEKLWAEERIEGFLGHVELETLAGRQVAVFTDHETEQRYVIDQSLEAESYWTSVRDPLLDFEQVFITGIVRPGATYAGLPVLGLTSSKYGADTRAATSADAFSVDVGPIVVNEAERQMGRLEGAFVVDRVELAYYYEPQPGYVIRSQDGPPPTPEPPRETIVQPVWILHGRNADGSVRFTAYVQAAVEELVRGE